MHKISKSSVKKTTDKVKKTGNKVKKVAPKVKKVIPKTKNLVSNEKKTKTDYEYTNMLKQKPRNARLYSTRNSQSQTNSIV